MTFVWYQIYVQSSNLPHSWFHYGATFEDSERRLRDHKVNGAFLVREQPDNKFRLVFRCAGAVSPCHETFPTFSFGFSVDLILRRPNSSDNTVMLLITFAQSVTNPPLQ